MRFFLAVFFSLILLVLALIQSFFESEGIAPLVLWIGATLGLLVWACAVFRKPVQVTRANLGERIVLLDAALTEPTRVASWEPVQAIEEPVGDWDLRTAARNGPDWDCAVRKARLSGWARFADGVIDFEAGVILLPRLLSPPAPRVDIRGGQTGFMVAWLAAPHSMALAHFSLTGRLRSTRRVAIADRGQATALSPCGMEWDDDGVRLYGFRQGQDGASVAVSVLKVMPPPL